MSVRRMGPARAVLVALLSAALFALVGCAAGRVSATTANSSAPYPTATDIATPAPSTASGISRGGAATPSSEAVTVDPSTTTIAVTVTPAEAGPAEPVTSTPAETRPAESVTSTPASAAVTPVVAKTPSVATTDPAAVPLFLTVTAPADELLEVPTGTAGVTISGKTVPSAVLSVNGNLVIPDDGGNFQVTVPVNDDVTLVEVVASDITGAEFHVQRVIVRD